jgi:hypothetical protein
LQPGARPPSALNGGVETPITSAASSIVNPPKKRSSTILLLSVNVRFERLVESQQICALLVSLLGGSE